MNAPLTALATPGNLAVAMCAIGRDARSASHALALAPAARKNNALAGMAKAIRLARSAILDANAEDVAEAKSGGATAAFLDRRGERARGGERGGRAPPRRARRIGA